MVGHSAATNLLAIDPFAAVQHAEFREYLPYLIPIGLLLVWYIRGIAIDVFRDFLRVRRRRLFRVIRRSGVIRSYGYSQHYLGELGPCVGSVFYEPWQRWCSRRQGRVAAVVRHATRFPETVRKGA